MFSIRPTGDQIRILVTKRAKDLLNFEVQTDIREVIKQTIEWYIANKDTAEIRGKELHG